MAYKLVETALAQADLDAILSNEVEKCYAALEQLPYLYEQCRDPRLSSKGYRKAVIKHYLLIYRVDEAQKTVYLLRFFYGRQNYETLL